MGLLIALLVALEREASGLRKRLALTPKEAVGLDGPVYTGRYRGCSLLLAQVGMGRRRAEAGAEAVLARYRVGVVISIGFSGALVERLQVGDLVLASELRGIAGPGGGEIEPTVYRADPGLLRAAADALRATPLRVASGPTVTTPGIVATPAEKRELARRTGALAVDMESYWLARAASARRIPFLALRAISDGQGDFVPPLTPIVDADGGLRIGRLAAFLIRKPGNLAALMQLARNAGRARRALTEGAACTVAGL